MNLKPIYSALLLTLLSAAVYAQKTDTSYYDTNWKVTAKGNSTYYRITKTTEPGKYEVEDYYNSGKIQMEGTYSSFSPDVKNGVFTWYYENGSKRTETVYENNKEKSSKSWLENGEEDKRGI